MIEGIMQPSVFTVTLLLSAPPGASVCFMIHHETVHQVDLSLFPRVLLPPRLSF